MPRTEPGVSLGTEPTSALRLVVLSTLLVGTAAPLLWEPVRSLFVDGIFSWSVGQPSTRQGGFEVVALYLLVAVTTRIVRRPAHLGAALLLPLSLYLRRHHVDFAVVGALAYVEALIGLGAAIERMVRGSRPVETVSYLRWFLAGVTVWALTIVGASIGDLATPLRLRILFAVIAVPALAFARRPPLTIHLFRRFLHQDRRWRWLGAFFVVFLAALFARTNAAPDHDSLWYGFRSHLVLSPSGSIFEPLGLTASVHYYPKLFEALLLPLAGLGDFSLVAGLNLAALALLALTSYVLARRMGLDPLWSQGAAAMVITLPAAAGVAVGAKPDVFAALLLALASLFFWRFVEDGTWSQGALGLAAVSLAWITKLTSLPYGGLLVAGSGGAWLWRRRRRDRAESGTARDPLAWITLCGSAVAGVAFTLRTYLLAGVPTVVPMGLWNALGLRLESPVGVLAKERAADGGDAWTLARMFLLTPDALPHVRTTWTGNVWFWLLVAAVILVFASRERSRRLGTVAAWVPVIAAGVLFALFYNNSTEGGDGNYYIYPLTLSTLLAVRAAAIRAGPLAPLLGLLAAGFVGQQATVSFVTCQWDPGTRILDLDFRRTVFDTRATREAILQRNGLDDVAAFLDANRGVERVVGYGPESVLRWLPARFESLRVISFFHPDLSDRPVELLQSLHEQRIGFLIVPRVRRSNALSRVLAVLEKQPGVRTLDDDLYRLVDLRAVLAKLPGLADQLAEPERRKVHYRLHEHLGEARVRGQGAARVPWRARIAPIDPGLQLFTGRRGLITHPGTALRFTVDLPDAQGVALTAQVGFHPAFVVDSDSDGAIVSVVVTGSADDLGRIWRRELSPPDGFVPVTIDLAAFRGHRVEVDVAVANLVGRDDRQDWVVWVAPRVESSPAGAVGHQASPALRPPR